nr:hypothetical protein [Methylomarinum sp. Ch1-1]MDP4521316.1 hypothetical protein [Methylomarinum sp. Ch1-1]
MMLEELLEIEEQLSSKGRLLEQQKAFLRDAITRYKDGESLDDAFRKAVMPQSGRGKQSVSYRSAKMSRDRKLLRAFSLLEGSHWARCIELARLSANIHRAIKSEAVNPTNEVERLIVRAIDSGVPLPRDTRGFHDALKPFFTDKSNTFNRSVSN